MHNVRKLTEDLYYVGADDHRLALFENVHPLYHGVSYNSYLLLDEKTVLFDTADWAVGRQFIENVEYVLGGRSLDVLVVNHVEPDHAATIPEVLLRWPDVKIIATAKAIQMMGQFGIALKPENTTAVKDGVTECFGKHTVRFVTAPMVHWPEVMVTFDETDGTLFAADAFGSFRALDGKVFADEVDYDREWLDEARRYYTNIVGKFGAQVQGLMKKAGALEIKMICPLHGLIWRKPEDIAYLLDKYTLWSTYTPEEKGVMIVYGSMYGGTENAAAILATKLAERGITNTRLYDVSSTPVSYLISDAFKYSHIVFACATYNLGIFPPMHDLLADMQALMVQKRTCAVIGNGTWAPKAAPLIHEALAGMKEMTVLEESFGITSAVSESDDAPLEALADALKASLEA